MEFLGAGEGRPGQGTPNRSLSVGPVSTEVGNDRGRTDPELPPRL